MPLLRGTSNSIVAENIREMRASGYPEAQAVAASLRNAGKGRAVTRAKHAVTKPKSKGIQFRKYN